MDGVWLLLAFNFGLLVLRLIKLSGCVVCIGLAGFVWFSEWIVILLDTLVVGFLI